MMISEDLLLGQSLPDLGHHRRNRRQFQLLPKLAARPAAPWTQALDSEAEVEACYRLLRNRHVCPQAMLKPHVDAVLDLPVEGAVLNICDRTHICHVRARNADDTYDLGLGKVGFVVQVNMLVQEKGNVPLGVVRMQSFDRNGKQDLKESAHWLTAALEVAEMVKPAQPLVHVIDSEGDVYKLMAGLTLAHGDYVVRAGQDRRVQAPEMEAPLRLSQSLDQTHFVGMLTVPIGKQKKKRSPPKSKRNQKAKSTREAHVEIRVAAFDIQQPKNGQAKGWPETIRAHLITVTEIDPPKGAEAVEWYLWTSLPILTREDVLRVVSIYQKRWGIEELFQALKTGCNFENRPFQSRATAERGLALCFPTAVMLLRIRTLSRDAPKLPAETVLPEEILHVLRVVDPQFRRKRKPKIKDAFEAVARYGGHNPHKGEPGWRILGRGYEDLLILAEGWKAAMRYKARTKPKGKRSDRP